MAGHRKWTDIRGDVDTESGREQYELEVQTLGQVRRARELTQVQLARSLEVDQSQISRIERQGDLYLSTLASYIEAMGGELTLLAVFPDATIELEVGSPPSSAGVPLAGPPEHVTAPAPRELAAATSKAARAGAGRAKAAATRGTRTSKSGASRSASSRSAKSGSVSSRSSRRKAT
jgi:transcriptional regulator with XRE-family HTH domain